MLISLQCLINLACLFLWQSATYMVLYIHNSIQFDTTAAGVLLWGYEYN